MATKKRKRKPHSANCECCHFSGTVIVCAHLVSFDYGWDSGRPLTNELEADLESEAEERAKECIVEGYVSGELNCLVHDDFAPGGEEISGWWEIMRRK